jgi:hypothetical protein
MLISAPASKLVGLGAIGERELVDPLLHLFDIPVADLRSQNTDPAAGHLEHDARPVGPVH